MVSIPLTLVRLGYPVCLFCVYCLDRFLSEEIHKNRYGFFPCREKKQHVGVRHSLYVCEYGFDGSDRIRRAKREVRVVCSSLLSDRSCSGNVIPWRFHDAVLLPQQNKVDPGYLKARFNESSRVFNAAMFVVNMILVSGIALYLQALIFHTFLGWNWDLSIWLSAAFVALYVTLGGLLSAMFTEILQFFLIWAGILILPILGLVDIGGPAAISHSLSEGFKTLWSTSGSPQNNPMYITWGGLVLGLGFAIAFGYWTTDFLIIQRAFSAKDLRSARMTPIIGSYFKLLLGAVVVGTGLIALVLMNNPASGFTLLIENGKTNYDSVIPLLMCRYFTPGLIGVGVTSMVAMFMAGMAGNMSSFNAVWTYDIYHSVSEQKCVAAKTREHRKNSDNKRHPPQCCRRVYCPEHALGHRLSPGN